MTRKSLGFVPLVWNCAFCSTQNPGPIKSCTGCGAPQPDNVKFLLVDEDRFNFIKDEALLRMAKAGPDIHCPFCGTRNPSTADLCSKCGGEISMGGKARQSGQRVKTVAEANKRPPASTPEPKKKRGPLFTIFAILGLLAIIAGCITLIALMVRTDDVSATVAGVQWQRSIMIEEYMTVTASDWWDEIPEDAEIQSCSYQYRYDSEDPQPVATQVCGEVFYEETGTGAAEAVQECIYEVYDDYCSYTANAWVEVNTLTETGNNMVPRWPTANLTTYQREGERAEDYTITFSGDGETYNYKTTDVDLFLAASPGSRWKLKVNQLNAVQSIEPAN